MLGSSTVATHTLALLGWWLGGMACAVLVIVVIGVLIPLRGWVAELRTPRTGLMDREEGRGAIFVATSLSVLVFVSAIVGTVVALHPSGGPTLRDARASAVALSSPEPTRAASLNPHAVVLYFHTRN